MLTSVFVVRDGSASAALAGILSCAAGPQQASLTFGATDTWHMVLATFKPLAGASTTTTSPTSTTTTSPTPTSTTTRPTTTTVPPTTTSTTTSTSTTTTTTLPGTTTGVTSTHHDPLSGQSVTFAAT